jgi:hypothetical protein
VRRQPRARSLAARGLCKVTVIVPEDCAAGLRQFAGELCARRQNGTGAMTPQWRTLSASAELMVNPECGARCAIRCTGAAGEDCYHWTVTLLGEDLPLATGRIGELGEARTAAEAALAAMTDSRNAEW